MNKKTAVTLSIIIVSTVIVGFFGCYYDLNEERHPTGPDRTGVQGWSLYVTITPSTAPANGTSHLSVQAKFWDLEDRVGIPNQEVFLAIFEKGGAPAKPSEASFPEGSITAQIWTDSQGLATTTIDVQYLPKHILEKEYYVRAEAVADFDDNAMNFWDIHYFRLYNPYYDGKPTPIPDDEDGPTAAFTFYPSGTVNCEPITFDASASFDTDATGEPAYDQIVNYMWYFGDGDTGFGKIVTHQYETDGNYAVDLVITDDEGFTGTTDADVDIVGCDD